MDVLNQLFSTFKVSAQVFNNGQYCGNWAVDTSGTSYMTFHVVSHGRCFLTINKPEVEQVFTLERGDIVLFPRDVGHCLSSDDTFQTEANQQLSQNFSQGVQDNATGLVCGYFAHNHPLISNITHYLPDYVIVRKGDNQSPGMALLLQALLQESVEADSGSELILGKMSETILALLFRDHLPSDTGVLAATLHPKLQKSIEAIHQQPKHKWSVEQLAELCFMSRAAFSELFKQVVGHTPMEYVTQWRLSLAYRMLADEQATTLEAALEAGYDNESSFSKAFKRVMGMTPGAVRAGASSSH